MVYASNPASPLVDKPETTALCPLLRTLYFLKKASFNPFISWYAVEDASRPTNASSDAATASAALPIDNNLEAPGSAASPFNPAEYAPPVK